MRKLFTRIAAGLTCSLMATGSASAVFAEPTAVPDDGDTPIVTETESPSATEPDAFATPTASASAGAEASASPSASVSPSASAEPTASPDDDGGGTSAWLSDWGYYTHKDSGTVELYAFIKEGTPLEGSSVDNAGKLDEYTIPASAEVSGETYRVTLSPQWFQMVSGSDGTNYSRVGTLRFERGFQLPEDCTSLFSRLSIVEKLDLSNMDVSSVKTIDHMLDGNYGPLAVDLSGLDLSGVTSADSVFGDDSSPLQFITTPAKLPDGVPIALPVAFYPLGTGKAVGGGYSTLEDAPADTTLAVSTNMSLGLITGTKQAYDAAQANSGDANNWASAVPDGTYRIGLYQSDDSSNLGEIIEMLTITRKGDTASATLVDQDGNTTEETIGRLNDLSIDGDSMNDKTSAKPWFTNTVVDRPYIAVLLDDNLKPVTEHGVVRIDSAVYRALYSIDSLCGNKWEAIFADSPAHLLKPDIEVGLIYEPNEMSLRVSKEWSSGAVIADKVTFDVLDGSGSVVKSGKLTKEGNWTAPVTLPAYDAFGNKLSYTVKETAPSSGYVTTYRTNADGSITIVNSPEHKATPTVLKIRKLGSDTGKGLKNCVITVRKIANVLPAEKQKGNDAVVPESRQSLNIDAEYTTDADGYAAIENAEMGVYQYIEKTAPTGYDVSDKTYTVYIHADGTVEGDAAFVDSPLKPTPSPTAAPTATPSATPTATPTVTSNPKSGTYGFLAYVPGISMAALGIVFLVIAKRKMNAE